MPLISRPHPDKKAPVRYLQGTGNYTWQHLRTGQKCIISTTLKKLLAQHYPQLLRIHKSVAVDVNQVARIVQDGEKAHQVELRDGTLLPISRRHYRNVLLSIGLHQRKTVQNTL